MKKFCSECGHPLEISKKFCSDCGTLNPFFSVSHEIPSARSGAIDALRARKESIDRELEEIEREQLEAAKKEKLRLEMEELEKQRLARLEKEKEIKERFEREGIEATIKKELQQVKDETEQYKKQTTELLKELRGVVYQIDEENKKLKEEVQQIAKVQITPTVSVNEVVSVPPIPEQDENETGSVEEEQALIQEELAEESSGNSWIIGVVILLVIVSVGLFAYFYSNYTDNIVEAETTITQPVTVDKPASTTQVQEVSTTTQATEFSEESSVSNTGSEVSDVAPAEQIKPKTVVAEVSKSESPKRKDAASNTTTEQPKPVEENFQLEISKVKADLLGKKLSGCGITLSALSEIQSISNPVMVENSSGSGYIKYKFSLDVLQAGEVYHVTPYIYYSPSGKFIKIDATNCE